MAESIASRRRASDAGDEISGNVGAALAGPRSPALKIDRRRARPTDGHGYASSASQESISTFMSSSPTTSPRSTASSASRIPETSRPRAAEPSSSS